MKYLSTRGGIAPIDFSTAVIMGLASDGGLVIPEQLPKFSPAELAAWSRLRFQELAVAVITPFVGDAIPQADLVRLIHSAYAPFQHPDITPVNQVGQRPILELFHVPTAAFKDVALQWLGNLFAYLLERSGESLNIIGATSGDTGSAAIAGVRGKPRINIFILHPKGRVSPIQERQMTTVLDANVHNIAVHGTFDDAQRIVKTLFSDAEFKRDYRLGAVNSINWARILAQTVYYFYAWGQISGGDPAHKVSFAVPTGNFGDVFAGYLARRMGLPIERLIIATNRNDILTRFVNTGIYRGSEVYHTLSPAMDIQLASNFERYLYYLFAENPATVASQMAAMQHSGELTITPEQQHQVQTDFTARAVSDAETLAQMRDTYHADGYVLCPHSAVGVRAATDWPEAICLATAHPAKFNEAVIEAIGQPAPAPPSLAGLLDMPTRCIDLAAEVDAVRAHLISTLGNHHAT